MQLRRCSGGKGKANLPGASFIRRSPSVPPSRLGAMLSMPDQLVAPEVLSLHAVDFR